MLLSIFLIFLGICIFLISLGYATGETAYSIAGFFIMFILGSTIILPGAIEYNSGKYINETYSYNNGTLEKTFITQTDIYSSAGEQYNKVWFGLIMSFLGIAGVTISWFEYRRGGRSNEEE